MKTILMLIISLFFTGILPAGCDLLVTGSDAVIEEEMGAGGDPCLVGNWSMSNEVLNNLLDDLAYVPGMDVSSGTLTLLFTEGDFAYASEDLVMHKDIPGGYMEADAYFTMTAAYAASGGNISFTSTVYDVGAITWWTMVDGELTEIPGESAFFFPIPGNGEYDCARNSLVLFTEGPDGPTALVFTREG